MTVVIYSAFGSELQVDKGGGSRDDLQIHP